MQITINGDLQEIDDGVSIAELILILKLDSRALAVEVNHELKPRELHQTTKIKDGDVLEIVTLVVGG